MRNPAEPEHAECDKMLSCMLRQLASVSPGSPILHPVRDGHQAVIDGFDGFEDLDGSSDESTEALIQLVDLYPSVTFITDALDEVNHLDRLELFDRLERIVDESQSLIKIFISSRENIDIELRLQGSPNLHIGAEDNSADISEFV